MFLSNPNLDTRGLRPDGRAHVYGHQTQWDLPGVLEYLTEPGPIDANMSAALRTRGSGPASCAGG